MTWAERLYRRNRLLFWTVHYASGIVPIPLDWEPYR